MTASWISYGVRRWRANLRDALLVALLVGGIARPVAAQESSRSLGVTNTGAGTGQPSTKCDGRPTESKSAVLRPSNLNGATFGCVVTLLWDGGLSTGAKRGAANLVVNMEGLARWIFILAALAEVAWLVVFGVVDSGYGSGAMGVPLHLARHLMLCMFFAFCLVNYHGILDALRDLAVNGSAVAQDEIRQAIGVPSADPTAIGHQIPSAENGNKVLAEWVTLRADPAHSTDANKVARWLELDPLVRDTISCFGKTIPDYKKNIADSHYASLAQGCRQIAARKEKAIELYGVTSEQTGYTTAGDFFKLMVGKFDIVDGLTMWAVGETLGLVFTTVTASISGIIALVWVMLAIVGLPLVAMLPFRKFSDLGKDWFKAIFAITLVPVLLSLMMGLWEGSYDMLMREASGSLMMTLMSQFIALAAMLFAAIGGYTFLNKLGGGVLDAGMQVGKMAASAGAAVATGGASAAASAYQATGGSFKEKATAALGAGLKGAGKSYAQQTTAMAGATAAALTGNRTPKDIAESSSAAAVRTGLDYGAKQAGAVGGRALAALGGGSLETPNRLSPATRGMQAREEAKAGADLGKSLSVAGGDYTKDSNTQKLALTPQGDQKVTDYRSAERDSFRATSPLSNAAFVNQPGISARMQGTHQSPLDRVLGKDTGTVDRTIAEQLPKSVQAARPGESTPQHAARLNGEVDRIKQTAGSSWKAVDRQVGRLNDVASREAITPNGQRFGVNPDDVSLGVEEKNRRYTAMVGSTFDNYKQSNPNRSDEQSYQAVKGMTQASTPRLPAENDAAYMDRVHAQVFTV
jgi:hypothetical protein